MQLERIAAVIRPRGGWEAVDFGFAMARRWRRGVWSAWWVAVAPAWALAYLPLALAVHPLWGLLAAWWLRPLFDRVPLAVLSRALFGDVPSPWVVVRGLPRLWGAGAVASLTLRRFDPARSFRLPVHQLEGLAGGARSRRLAVLGRQRSDTAAGLTLACAVMELCFLLALFGLAAMLVPAGIEVAWKDHLGAYSTGTSHPAFTVLAGAFAFLAFTAVEPFYVAAGFALYLDRRTHLEGWDVELAFRRLAGRLRAAGRRGAAAALLALVLVAPPAAPLAAATPAAGGATPTSAAAARDPAQAAAEILAQPDFATRHRVQRWRLRDRWLVETEEPDRPPLTLSLGLLALAGEILLWAVALTLLAVLVVRVARRARRPPRGRSEVAEASAPPAVLFGLELAAESLPADVPGAALEAFRAGRATEALGLLYRGALARLARRRSVAASWTEEECVRHLAAVLDDDGGAWFRGLAAGWQAAAYGHRPPAAAAFADLCAGWRAHLEAMA